MSDPQPSVADRYRRVDDFEVRAAELRLRPIQWRLVLALDGVRTLGGVAQSLGIPTQEAVEMAAHFEGLGLVDTPRLTLGEYRGPAKGEPAPAPVAPPRPRETPAWPPPAPPPPAVTRLATIEPIRPSDAPAEPAEAAPEPAAMQPAEAAAPRISFSLKSRPADAGPPEGGPT